MQQRRGADGVSFKVSWLEASPSCLNNRRCSKGLRKTKVVKRSVHDDREPVGLLLCSAQKHFQVRQQSCYQNDQLTDGKLNGVSIGFPVVSGNMQRS